MRIAVDIDDTLNVLDRAGVGGAYIARNGLPFRVTDEHANAFVRVFDWTEDDVMKFIRAGGVSAFVEARVRKGAAQALGGWIADGLEVVILTARKKSWFKNPENLSRDWLEKRKIPYSSLVVEEDDKGLYCARHHISVLVDDNLDNCLGAQKRGVCAVLAIGKCNEKRRKEIYFGSGDWAGLDRVVRRIVRTMTIEDLTARACPSRNARIDDGWEIRSDLWRGLRGNCVRPVLPSEKDMRQKAEEYERTCAREGRVCRYLLTECDASLDRILAERGYGVEANGQGMILGKLPDEAPCGDLVISSQFEAWTKAYRAVTGETGVLRAYAYAAGRQIFAAVYEEQTPVAVGMAVLDRGALGLFDVCVRQDRRRKGYGKKIVGALLAEGKERGAEYAYLQTETANTGALALFRPFGFQKAYRYWYRVKRTTVRGGEGK